MMLIVIPTVLAQLLFCINYVDHYQKLRHLGTCHAVLGVAATLLLHRVLIANMVLV